MGFDNRLFRWPSGREDELRCRYQAVRTRSDPASGHTLPFGGRVWAYAHQHRTPGFQRHLFGRQLQRPGGDASPGGLRIQGRQRYRLERSRGDSRFPGASGHTQGSISRIHESGRRPGNGMDPLQGCPAGMRDHPSANPTGIQSDFLLPERPHPPETAGGGFPDHKRRMQYRHGTALLQIRIRYGALCDLGFRGRFISCGSDRGTRGLGSSATVPMDAGTSRMGNRFGPEPGLRQTLIPRIHIRFILLSASTTSGSKRFPLPLVITSMASASVRALR